MKAKNKVLSIKMTTTINMQIDWFMDCAVHIN